MREQLKVLGKHSFIYTISNLLTKAVGIILIPVYVRNLSQYEYGILSMLAPVSAILIVFFDFGFKSTITRFFFDYPDRSKKQKLVLGNLVSVISVFIIVMAVFLVLLGSPIFNKVIPNIKFWPYVVLIIGTSATQLLFEIKLTIFRSRSQSLYFGLFSFTRFLMIVLFTIVGVVEFKMGALGKLIPEFIISTIFAGISIGLLLKDIIFNFNFSLIKLALNYALPLLPHMFVTAFSGLVGKYFINKYYGLAEVGIFNIAFLLASLMAILVLSINQIWAPYFFKVASDDESNVNALFSKLTTYYVIGICAIGLALITFSKEFVLLVASNEYIESVKIIPILTIAYIFTGFYYVASSKLYYKKTAAKYLPLSSTMGFIVNVLVSLLLIKSYGMLGAAWATLASNLVIFGVSFYLSQKYFYINYEVSRILKIVIVFVFSLLNLYFLNLYVTSPISNIFSKLLIVPVFFGLLLFFKFFKKEELNWLKKIIRFIRTGNYFTNANH